MKVVKQFPVWLISILYLSVFIFSINQFFFWDTVQLASKHATYFYQTGFRSLILPSEADSGHIPGFGIYLAGWWTLFGRSLWVSHLAMLPFIAGILIQAFRLIKFFIPRQYIYWAYLLFLFDPTLLAQAALVSPAIPLVFFLLLALNSILKHQRIYLVLAACGLILTSLRGINAVACLALFDMYFTYRTPGKNKIRILTDYIPAALLTTGYLFYHYQITGWAGIPSTSPWQDSFIAVGIKGILRNTTLYGWRLVDFGRLAVWLIAFILICRRKGKITTERDSKLLWVLLCIFLFIFPLNTLWASGLTGHRYYLPVYLCVALFTVHLLFHTKLSSVLRTVLAAGWIISITAGCFLVYPRGVAQGWDATPAHFPYYSLRKEAIHFLSRHQIADNEVQSFFPNYAQRDYIDLDGNKNKFEEFNGGSKYVFYSNVFNVSDHDLSQLDHDYTILQRFARNNIEVILYRRL